MRSHAVTTRQCSEHRNGEPSPLRVKAGSVEWIFRSIYDLAGFSIVVVTKSMHTVNTSLGTTERDEGVAFEAAGRSCVAGAFGCHHYGDIPFKPDCFRLDQAAEFRHGPRFWREGGLMESQLQGPRWAKPLLTGFTVPAILGVDLATGRTMVVGLDPTVLTLLAFMFMLSALAFVLSAFAFAVPRTTVLEGPLHLAIFLLYAVLIFSP